MLEVKVFLELIVQQTQTIYGQWELHIETMLVALTSVTYMD